MVVLPQRGRSISVESVSSDASGGSERLESVEVSPKNAEPGRQPVEREDMQRLSRSLFAGPPPHKSTATSSFDTLRKRTRKKKAARNEEATSVMPTIDEISAAVHAEMDEDPSEQARYNEVFWVSVMGSACVMVFVLVAMLMEHPWYADKIRAAMLLSAPPHPDDARYLEHQEFTSTLRRSKHKKAGHVDVGDGLGFGPAGTPRND